MAIDIQNVTAVQNEKQEGVIGHLCWYSVGEHLVTRDELKAKLVASGLGEGWLPNEIRVADAFRRATREVQRRQKSSIPNVFLNFLVREVFSDKDQVQRNVVIETVDQQGKRLDYNSTAAVLVLDKKTTSMFCQIIDPQVEELVKEAEQTFKIYKDNYSAQTIRIMAMNILKSMSPTPVRPNGGVYFVPSGHTEQLKKWVNFIKSLDKGEAFKVPLVNSFDNLEMVSTKLEEHLCGVINECEKAINREVKKYHVKAIIDDARRVIGDFNQYRNILESDIDRFEKYVNRIREQVTLLIEGL